ncbi:MAG: hypothetical protein AB9869_00925 [Verrucomicrobiia bacterium]
MNSIEFRSFVLAVSLVGLSPSASAATLTNVPMQGTMVMPMIRYDAASGRLQVTLDPTVPELTPLLASNPNDQFDPADPWFDLLDPSRQGLAFSRRYGFVMDTATDPLPDGTKIWLRKLSGSGGLGIYRYRASEPKLWEPIFGTAGSPNALEWSGMMFHPGVTALPGSGSYKASFEAVLVNSATGAEVSGSGTGPFEMNWTTASDGRPVVSIGLKVVVAYPDTPGYVLECAEMLEGGTWSAVTNQPVMIDGQRSVVLDPSEACRFYRMRQAP